MTHCQHPVQFPLQCACDDGGDDVYHCCFYDALRKRKRRTRRDLLGQKLERKKEIWNDGGGLKWERRIDAGNFLDDAMRLGAPYFRCFPLPLLPPPSPSDSLTVVTREGR